MDFIVQTILGTITGYVVSSAVVMFTPNSQEGNKITTIFQILIVGTVMNFLSQANPNKSPSSWAEWGGMSVSFMVLTNAMPPIVDALGSGNGDDDDDSDDGDDDLWGQIEHNNQTKNPKPPQKKQKQKKEACCWDCGMNDNLYFNWKKEAKFNTYGLKY